MGQNEILDYLKAERKLNENWYSVADIKTALIKKGYSNGCLHRVYDNLYKLAAFNLIQVKGCGIWEHKKLFRAYK